MTDLLIRDVDVVDGTGAASYRADVLVDKGRITEIASPRTLSGADKTIAPESGYVLAPGFIDMHAHSDLRLLTDPGHFPKVSQGVTTEVIGQDGISYAPIDDVALDIVRRQIAGWNGNPSDLDFSWRSVADYLDRLDQGITPNAAYLVPQGTLRLLAVGADQRPATPTEIDRMQELLAQGLSEGAVGMSSGLTYTPGMYADTAELAALCEVVAEFGGFYAPHTRSYGAGALEAYAEMIELSREHRLRTPFDARDDELRRQSRAGTGVSGHGRRRSGRWMRHHAGYISVSAGRHHPVGSAAELGNVRRPGQGARASA